MHKPSSLKDYVVALLFGACFFALVLAYLTIRQGDPETFGINIESRRLFNLAFADAGALLIGLTFLIGPLVRSFNAFDSWLQYRKEFGVVGAFFIFAHGYLSATSQAAQGGLDLFARGGAALWGMLAILTLLFLLIISAKAAIALLGGQRWWLLQRWGIRLVALLTFFHIFALRFPGWRQWYFEQTTLPPTGLLVALFLSWVILIRLYEGIFLFRSFGWAARELPPEGLELRYDRHFLVISFILFLAIIAFIFLH